MWEIAHGGAHDEHDGEGANEEERDEATHVDACPMREASGDDQGDVRGHGWAHEIEAPHPVKDEVPLKEL